MLYCLIDLRYLGGMLIVYTDGGCSGNPGPGAWAYIIADGNKVVKNVGAELQTTNNRMELVAVIRALEHICSKEVLSNREVEAFTDSLYVKKGITEWIVNWVRNGWKSAGKKPVKNKDLWMKLLSVSKRLEVRWKWVMGHSGDEYNEQCDRLVKKEIRRITAV